jgi:hypothetical protein
MDAIQNERLKARLWAEKMGYNTNFSNITPSTFESMLQGVKSYILV